MVNVIQYHFLPRSWHFGMKYDRSEAIQLLHPSHEIWCKQRYKSFYNYFYQRFVLAMLLGNSFLQLMMGCSALIAIPLVLKVRQTFLLPFWCNKESNEKIKKGCRHFVNVFTIYVCGFKGNPRAVAYFLFYFLSG